MKHKTTIKLSSISQYWLDYVKAVNPETPLDLIVVTIHCLAVSIKQSIRNRTQNTHNLSIFVSIMEALDGIINKDFTIEVEDADEMGKKYVQTSSDSKLT